MLRPVQMNRSNGTWYCHRRAVGSEARATCQRLGWIELETEAKQFSALCKVNGLYRAQNNFVAWVFDGEQTWGPEARECAFEFVTDRWGVYESVSVA